MNNRPHCQSCCIPLDDPEILGTEKDGSKNQDYCTYCYQNGKFTNPGMSLDKMRSLVIGKMEKEKVPEDIIETTVSSLSQLKRWKMHKLPE